MRTRCEKRMEGQAMAEEEFILGTSVSWRRPPEVSASSLVRAGSVLSVDEGGERQWYLPFAHVADSASA